ncbi:MAG TPA: twin-arginine translocation signal domain-containing protein, partial [Burkholderiales bacterium]|nr:twin-arginine translocation signal domain-containing protein [Burkholderiales bacterium]
MHKKNISRRHFIALAGASGAAALSGPLMTGGAFANRHPHPRPTSLAYLDRNMYRKHTTVLAHFDAGEERGAKMQMMAIGSRRYLFNRGDVIDVSDPLNPTMFNKKGYVGNQVQLAYNKKLGKWILMTGAGVAGTFSTPKAPHGKYDEPAMIQQNINQKGLRGVRFYDASDPAKIVPLSQWSCDQGDPKRELQTGSGTHRSYYDGGQYAYLDTGPDGTFVNMEAFFRYYTNGIQIIDASDPAKPRFVSNWWVPGQKQ